MTGIIGPRSADVERLMDRCRAYVGKRNAANEARSTLAACHDALGALLRARDTLAAWIIADCECPCCGRVDVCADDCTAAHDDGTAHGPAIYARMQAARSVLFAEHP